MSEDDSWTQTLQHRGQEYVLHFSKRPFREGLEVKVLLNDEEILSFGELGLGETALIERVKLELDRVR